jgi:hypothetical protein
MPSKEEKERRKKLVKALGEEEHAEAIAKLPLSKQAMREMFDWVDDKLQAGCDTTLQYTLEFIRGRGLPEEEIVKWLKEYGGGCDCEVIANVEGTWRDDLRYLD